MIKRVYLHGLKAAQKYYEVEARTVFEAIEFLSYIVPELKPNIHRGPVRLSVAECPNTADLHKQLDTEEIHVAPAMLFGKDNGVVQIVVGAALIVGGLLVTPFAPQIGAGMVAAGIGLIVGSLISYLMPQPAVSDGGEETRSKYLGAPANTVRIGTHVPILLGRRRCGGHLLSVQIDAKDTLS